MYLNYCIKHINRNIPEIIKELKPEDYQSMLVLEAKVVELLHVNSVTDELSQQINLSEIDIVETFNEGSMSCKQST